jgi:hypothetical protein
MHVEAEKCIQNFRKREMKDCVGNFGIDGSIRLKWILI